MDFDYLLLPLLIASVSLLITWLSMRRVVSLRSKPFGVARKAIEGLALSLAALITFALAASSAVNAVMYISFRHDPPGAFYQIDGDRMRIECRGSGSPTLVLESGLANGGFIWAGVLPALSGTTRVCSYDRAGYDWSDPVMSPRDADHIADQLHGLLAAAHIDGPIVLMGHSLGGIYVRDYAARYPAHVAGLILVDSSIPLQDKQGVTMNFPPRLLVQAALSTGIAHWVFRLQYPKVPGRAIDDACYPNLQEASEEMANFDRSGEETVHDSSYGSLPILIVSHDPTADVAGSNPSDVRGMRIFDQMQRDLLELSTRSRRTIARGSGHVIQFDRPQLLEKEVVLFIEQILGTAPPPAQYGTTVTK